MLWECPDARSLWEMWLRAWEWTGGKEDTGITAIFSLTLKTLPQWIVDWGQEQEEGYWDHLHTTASQMWAIGCATIITALWRRNVDHKYPSGRKPLLREGELHAVRAVITDGFRKYRMGRAPLTGDSIKKMQIADHIIEKWLKTTTGGSTPEVAEVQHLGFFDGGSRGNPGPGGSGRVRRSAPSAISDGRQRVDASTYRWGQRIDHWHDERKETAKI
ncbi:hypothetical protein PI124_g10292 [Phytophthora idaei]|nr:hypothetical protein PI125_g8527 [Phytophthora idaei]KAG3157359.1 hypothetical protein PI126_g8363 [Phytophthora idaei]KAG3244945.1 hypothetical protein PI124_g10292 [Phytophthora idaei]